MSAKINPQPETISLTLARYFQNFSYADLPEEVSLLAKGRILDTLSCAYAGQALPHSQVAIKFAKNSPGPSTVFGSGVKAGLLDAIMANCVLAHSILMEDTMAGHPSTTVVPAALSVGESEAVSGKELLAAIVLGYEMMSRVCSATAPMPVLSFREGVIMATQGTVAAAGKLMRLNAEKLAHAIGYAATLAHGAPGQTWWAGTMDSMFEAGAAARTGVLACRLAQAGATAAPDIFEGKDGFLKCWAGTTERAHLITDGLGASFAIKGTFIKPYPACFGTQLVIQTLLPLASRGLKAGDIRAIKQVMTPKATWFAGSNFKGPFRSHFQAIMSVQFCTAATLLGRDMSSVSLYAEHYDDPEIAELAQKVEVVKEEDDRFQPKAIIYLNNGETIVAEETPPNMEPLTPSWEKMVRRFAERASYCLGQSRTGEIIEMVKTLESVDDIRRLMVLL